MNRGTLRNKPCPCGSGKKFKKCCMGLTPEQHRQKAAEAWAKLSRSGSPAAMGDVKEGLLNEARVRTTIEADAAFTAMASDSDSDVIEDKREEKGHGSAAYPAGTQQRSMERFLESAYIPKSILKPEEK